MCVGFLLCKLLQQLAAAAAVGLRFLPHAAAAISRCRCWFSFYLLLLCWLAAFVARLDEIVVFSSRVFIVHVLLKSSKLQLNKCQNQLRTCPKTLNISLNLFSIKKEKSAPCVLLPTGSVWRPLFLYLLGTHLVPLNISGFPDVPRSVLCIFLRQF